MVPVFYLYYAILTWYVFFHLDFVVDRDVKYGGPVVFKSYKELEEAYVRQDVYPLDLKTAVTRELNIVSSFVQGPHASY